MKIFVLLALSLSMMLSSVDINNATVKELTTLRGIGKLKAQAIVKYREKIKCFKSIKELQKIRGIGKKILEKNIDNIKIGECKM